MTPKEKAEELFDKFYGLSNKGSIVYGKSNLEQRSNAKEIFDICFEEIMQVLESGNLYMEFTPEDSIGNPEYWLQVRKQVSKIFIDRRIDA